MSIENFHRTIIVEGVTTSGKSTIVDNLRRYAKEHDLSGTFLPEEKTVIPCIDSTNLKHNQDFLRKLLQTVFAENKNLYVFDRLHFTHTIKTNSTIKDFVDIESSLKQRDATLFFIDVPEEALKKRLLDSLEYRNVQWVKYVMERSDEDQEKFIDFYVQRQRLLRKLFDESTLTKYIIDSDDQNYIRMTRTIIDTVKMRPDHFLETK